MIAWGVLAAAAPVIIYLIMRQRYKVVVWAAMEFLLAAYKKTRRRRRIEELLLLAIRTLLMLLLPLGLAHPVWNASAAILGQEEAHWVIVLDDSYSMGYRDWAESSFQRAKAAACEIVDRMRGKGWATVFQANAVRARTIPVEGNRHDVLKEAIEDLSISHAGSNLLECLGEVLKAVKERRTVVRHDIFILTDMQRSAWTAGSTKDPEILRVLEEIAKLVRQVYLVDVGPSESIANLQIQAFHPSSRTITPGRSASFEVRVRNMGSSRADAVAVDFFVGAGDGRIKRGGEVIESLDRGEERTLTFPVTFDKPGAYPLSVSLPGDALAVDNERCLAAVAREKIRVLLVNGEPGREGPEGDETFFLQAALELTPELSPFAVKLVSFMNFDSEIDLLKHDVVVLANLPTVDPRQAGLLEQFARDGGVVILTVGEHVLRDRAEFNAILYKGGQGVSPAQLLEEVVVADPAWLGLSAVADHAFIRTSRLNWEPLAVGARFRKAIHLGLPEGGDSKTIFHFIHQSSGGARETFPALVEKPLGLGRVILFGSAIDADWGFDTVFFAQQEAYYPPLWYEILFHYMQSGEKRNIGVGEQFEMVLPPEELSRPVEVRRLDPQAPPAVTVYPVAVENRAKLVYPEDPEHLKGEGTEASGLYEIKRAGSAARPDYVAVTIDPEEGDLRQRMEAGEAAALFPDKFPLTVCVSREALWEKIAGKGTDRDLWKPFLIAVFTLLCLETILAWRFGRQ